MFNLNDVNKKYDFFNGKQWKPGNESLQEKKKNQNVQDRTWNQDTGHPTLSDYGAYRRPKKWKEKSLQSQS